MLGEKIRLLREKQGISLEDLAAGLNEDVRTVSLWEYDVLIPEGETMIRIAEALHVSVNELLEEGIIENIRLDGNALEDQSAPEENVTQVNNGKRGILLTVVLFLAAILFLSGIMLFLVNGLSVGALKGSGSDLTEADRANYEEKEIDDAKKIVEDFFSENFKDCELLSLEYDEALTIEQGKEWRRNSGADEVMILVSNFQTGDMGSQSVLEPYHIYENYQWVMTRRENKNWRIYSRGY